MAVEFVHPVIVGKRALPAFALTGSDLVQRAQVAVRAGDILIAVAGGRDADVAGLMRRAPAWGATSSLDRVGAAAARRRGRPRAVDRRSGPDGAGHRPVRAALPPAVGADPRLLRAPRPADQPRRWLVMRPGTGGQDPAGRREPQPAGFLYPFIDADERDPEPLLADLATSARAKAAESAALQQATLAASADPVAACGAAMAERFAAGGRLYAFGNGGSSTDCATFATLFASPPAGRQSARRRDRDDRRFDGVADQGALVSSTAGPEPGGRPGRRHRARQRRRLRPGLLPPDHRPRERPGYRGGLLHQRELPRPDGRPAARPAAGGC